MQGYRHVHPLEVRFKDIDSFGHVNNAVIITYFETARVHYLVELDLRPVRANLLDLAFILAHLSCDFKSPIFYGQKVTVGSRITQINRSSLRLEHRLEADDQLAAEGYCILVHYDYSQQRSVPISPQMRALIEAFEGLK